MNSALTRDCGPLTFFHSPDSMHVDEAELELSQNIDSYLLILQFDQSFVSSV